MGYDTCHIPKGSIAAGDCKKLCIPVITPFIGSSLSNFMNRNNIEKAFDKKFIDTSKHFNCLNKNFGLEDLHNFRVEIKKLRAFIRLINAGIASEKKIKLDKYVKRFYNAAGAVRNFQLHQQRVIALCGNLALTKPLAYLNVLKSYEISQQKNANKLAEIISFKRFRKKVDSKIPENLNEGSIQTFLMQKRHELIELLLLNDVTDETLHEIRKILKDILYNWKYIKSYIPSVFSYYFTTAENIESLTVLLGNSQDLCTALSFLRDAYLDDIINEEKEVLICLKQILQWRKKTLKGTIIFLLADIKKEIEKEDVLQEVYEIL